MRKEIHPAVLAIAVVVLIAIAGGVYYFAGVASTKSGHDTSKGMGVQAAGGHIPQQSFVPHAQ